MKIRTLTLDWKQFSEDAFNELKEALEDFNLYLGDLIEDLYGENNSDTYALYICKRKLKQNEIRDQFPIGNLEDGP
ncbi:MAG: hypothetical protein ACFFG0_00495 [Candidatus Thorarchaeota archaeon]